LLIFISCTLSSCTASSATSGLCLPPSALSIFHCHIHTCASLPCRHTVTWKGTGGQEACSLFRPVCPRPGFLPSPSLRTLVMSSLCQRTDMGLLWKATPRPALKWGSFLSVTKGDYLVWSGLGAAFQRSPMSVLCHLVPWVDPFAVVENQGTRLHQPRVGASCSEWDLVVSC
jgi:hypothetical protein